MPRKPLAWRAGGRTLPKASRQKRWGVALRATPPARSVVPLRLAGAAVLLMCFPAALLFIETPCRFRTDKVCEILIG
jgi:hypothetical protein